MIEIGKNIDFDFFLRFLEGVQRMLGDQCEIVIHDYRMGKEHTVVHILNGQLSGRSVGSSTRGVAFTKEGEDLEKYKDGFIFFYKGKNDKYFKSSTTFISDENQRIIGSVCFNVEITGLMNFGSFIQNFLGGSGMGKMSEGTPKYDNVDEMLHHYVQQSEMLIGKPKPLMTKEEKIQAIGYLDEKGVFKISRAGALLCEEFQISKFTLYNYLEESKKLRGISKGGQSPE